MKLTKKEEKITERISQINAELSMAGTHWEFQEKELRMEKKILELLLEYGL